MAQVINTNYLSLTAQNNLNKSQSALGSAIERLSSGMRINSSKDDAAGQAIANRFTANINGLTQAARNANDGISITQTTEGALNEINNNLQRIRELTVQAVNGTNSGSDMASIQGEIDQRLAEINRVSEQTQFNSVKVLSQDNTLKLQVGANDNEIITIDLKKVTSDALGINNFNVTGKGEIANKAAQLTDVTRLGATGTGLGPYTLTTTFTALNTEVAFSKLNEGDTVDVGGETYTYNAKDKNFTLAVTKSTTAETTPIGTNLMTGKPGEVRAGEYENGGKKIEIQVDGSGNISIKGNSGEFEKAYVTTNGALSTQPGAGPVEATMSSLFTAASDADVESKLTFGGKEYTFPTGGGTGVTYKDTLTSEAVALKVDAAGAATNINYHTPMGTTTVALAYNAVAGGGVCADRWFDSDNDIQTVASITTEYTVNVDDLSVYVSGGDGTGKYKANIGDKVYVSADDKLTTKTTSQGTATQNPLAALDKALAKIDASRSELGAAQNRLTSTITNLNNTVNNLSAARSRIEDADYATEVSNMTRSQILQQAGTSVLAQANQIPQNVLSLLR